MKMPLTQALFSFSVLSKSDSGIRLFCLSFPKAVQVCSAEVTISRNLFVDRSEQIEVLDDRSGTQVEVLLYQFCDLIIGDFACTECIYQNGNGMCNADGVSQLYFAVACDAGGNDVLCNVSSHVGRASVNLCRVLAGERTAAVSSDNRRRCQR